MSEASPEWPEAVLRWYLDAGVDEVIGDRPVDRFRAASAGAQVPLELPRAPVPTGRASPVSGDRPYSADSPSARRARPAPPPPPATPAVARGVAREPIDNATALAQGAASLDELRETLAAFTGCLLSKTATNLVFADGSASARLVLIGEAPGAEEDRQGLPFVGPSGRLLDRMLASIGLDRRAVFISNTVFWRPPGNRSPTTAEVAVCMPFVERMIELLAPQLLVALGGPAANALLGQSDSVGRLRGRWFEFRTAHMTQPILATAMFHPAYLLRSPAQKRLAWRDLLAVKRRLSEPHSGIFPTV